MKRLLFEVHRWVGIVLAVFMLMWFITGLTIVFTDPLPLTRAAQLAHAETLSPQPGWLSLGGAWEISAAERKAAALDARETRSRDNVQGRSEEHHNGGKQKDDQGNIVEARLLRIAGKPLWLVEDSRSRRFAISAIDGKLNAVSTSVALDIASLWLHHDGRAVANIRDLGTVESVSSLRNYKFLQPFHRIAVDDGTGTELLISAKTGEVLQASTRLERGLYYAGNWLHLFRPLDALGIGEYREEVLKWAAFFAFTGALTGLIIGWLRWRPGWFGHATYSEGRKQPYRAFWLKWHFWSGLIGGSFALLWALSGYIDSNPLNLFPEGNITRDETNRYLGAGIPAVMRTWRPEASTADDTVVELTWRRLGDQAILLASHRNGERLPVATEDSTRQFSTEHLLAAVQRLSGDAPVLNQSVLQQYDDYYYLRHHRDPATKPLPVIRVELGDAAGTHLYLNPQDGRLLLKRNNSSRLHRWLYSGLHHWDFGWLYQRPLWDSWMVTWILFGLVLGFSSVVVGWKRLVLTFSRPKRKERNKPEGIPQLASEARPG